MQIARQEDGSFTLTEVESPLLEILLAIPDSTLPQGDLGAEHRLYPSPSGDEVINAEWREYVRPGLEEWFKSASDTVQFDLSKLESAEEPASLTIPAENVEAWLNALNQARLALAARHEINDEDMERPTDSELASPREVALFQIHFYGFLQECLIKGLESE